MPHTLHRTGSPYLRKKEAPWLENRAAFGSLLSCQFDAMIGAVTGTWTDQVKQIALASPAGAVALATDGSNWRGRKVMQCVSGVSYLANSAPSTPIFLAGTRPYAMIVFRFTTFPAGTALPIRLLDTSGGTTTMALLATSGTTLSTSCESATASKTFSDTLPHIFESWLDASGVCNFRIDGGAITTNGTGISLTNNSKALSFGGTATGTLSASIALAAAYYCTSKPAENACGNVRQNMRIVYGTP